jgi:hypothetical protein
MEHRVPETMAERVDKAVNIMLECFDLNGINKSEAVSAMASLLASILSHYDDRSHFDNVIKLMVDAFEDSRKYPR